MTLLSTISNDSVNDNLKKRSVSASMISCLLSAHPALLCCQIREC
jgi:hypothetical protein